MDRLVQAFVGFIGQGLSGDCNTKVSTPIGLGIGRFGGKGSTTRSLATAEEIVRRPINVGLERSTAKAFVDYNVRILSADVESILGEEGCRSIEEDVKRILQTLEVGS